MLKTTFAGLHFNNPLIAASTDMARTEASLAALFDSGIGGVIIKSVTDIDALKSPHISRFDIRDMRGRSVRGEAPEDYVFFSRGGGMVPLADYLPRAESELRRAREKGVVLIGSISSGEFGNWVPFAKELAQVGFPMLELNFGNPHGEAAKGKAGFLLGQSPELCRRIITDVRKAVSIPVVVKLTPQVADIAEMAQIAKESGAAAVTVMHRFQGMVIDFEKEEPVLGGWAAIGGPWMKPLSLAAVSKVYRRAGIDICGGNGADTARDILEFIMAGASVVQIGSTLMLRGAGIVPGLLRDMEKLLAAKGLSSVAALRGRVADAVVAYQNLAAMGTRSAFFDKARCQSCAEKPCVSRCYFGNLRVAGTTLHHDATACTGCSLCAHICPLGAVSLG